MATTTGSDRYDGYRKALVEGGLPVGKELMRAGDFRKPGGRAAMRDLLRAEPTPDAVFVTNNRMAAGALEAIYEANLAVPGDIAIVGYDDIAWAPLLRTALTTVDQPAYDLGFESPCLLMSRIAGYTGAARTVVLPATLHIRASSAPITRSRRGTGEQRPAKARAGRRPVNAS